jgi:hypothetical protein
MNLAQALGAAAAALVMGLSVGAIAPARTMTEIAAEARARLTPSAMHGAVEAVAAALALRDVFPEVTSHYGGRLRARAEARALWSEDFAAQLASEWNTASGVCASPQPPRAEPDSQRVEMLLDRASWRHDLPDAQIHLGRRTARL